MVAAWRSAHGCKIESFWVNFDMDVKRKFDAGVITFPARPETSFVLCLLQLLGLPTDVYLLIASVYQRLNKRIVAMTASEAVAAEADGRGLSRVYRWPLRSQAACESDCYAGSMEIAHEPEHMIEMMPAVKHGLLITPSESAPDNHGVFASNYPFRVIALACSSDHTLVSTDVGVFGFGNTSYGRLGFTCSMRSGTWTGSMRLVCSPAEAISCWGCASLILIHGKLHVYGINRGIYGFGDDSLCIKGVVPIDNVRSFACTDTYMLVLADVLYVCSQGLDGKSLISKTEHTGICAIWPHAALLDTSGNHQSGGQRGSGRYADLKVEQPGGLFHRINISVIPNPDRNTQYGFYSLPYETLLAIDAAHYALEFKTDPIPSRFGVVTSIACISQVLILASNQGVFAKLRGTHVWIRI